MNERLQVLMKLTGLPSGKFAELIGVQPSSISHIISGRNKPGYDFIQKLIEAFPDIDPRWLITGKGESPAPIVAVERSDSLIENELSSFESGLAFREQELFASEHSHYNNIVDKQSEFNDFTQPQTFDNPAPNTIGEINNNGVVISASEVDMIVVFYTDGTFRKYKQSR